MKKRAFTLIELMVSISIIAILIAVASVSYGKAQKKARDTRRIDDMNAIQKAAEMYYSQNNYAYPSSPSVFTTDGVLQLWPKDPKGVGWTVYEYNVATTYCACAAVENTIMGNSNDSCTFTTSAAAYFCVKSLQ